MCSVIFIALICIDFPVSLSSEYDVVPTLFSSAGVKKEVKV
tara:strand:+ start:2063 stop:2185 length:123 start_codon:yes stop_codon:yes gene_type:complete